MKGSTFTKLMIQILLQFLDAVLMTLSIEDVSSWSLRNLETKFPGHGDGRSQMASTSSQRAQLLYCARAAQLQEGRT